MKRIYPITYLLSISFFCFADNLSFDNGINSIIFNHDTKIEHDLKSSLINLAIDFSLGINIDSWRFRQKTNYDSKYTNNKTLLSDSLFSLSRDIQTISNKLLIGDGYIPSNIIDGFSFRGVILRTNEKMKPNTLKSLAPEIRGIANNNSEIKIYQYGELIYSKQVPPGNFIINDVTPLESSGELEMKVRDADGSEDVRIIPYNSNSNIIKKNIINYVISVGKYRNDMNLEESNSKYILGTFSYGLSKHISLYTGVNYAQNYSSVAIGLGSLLGDFGSLSADLNISNGKFKFQNTCGEYLKLQYGKTWSESQTDIYIIGKHQISGQYLSFSDYIERKLEYKTIEDKDDLEYLFFEQKPYFSIEGRINKNINDTSSLYLSANHERYNKSYYNNTSISVGYSGEYNDVSFNIYGEVERNKIYGNDKKISINLAMPLNTNTSSIQLGYSKEISKNDIDIQKISLNGDINDDVYYNLSSKTNKLVGNENMDASLNYQSNYGSINIGYSSDEKYRVFSGDFSSSAIIYDDNIIFGNYFYDSAAIISVPGQKNIEFDSHYGIKTNNDGYVILTDLNVYRENKISIDYSSLPDDVYIETDEISLFPTDGSIIFRPFILNGKSE